jgi:DNA-binding transcriptional LysR family regulator
MRLPEIVASFAGEYPAVTLSITTGNTSELIRQVIDQHLDGAFVAAPVNHSELIQEPLFQEELVLASHASLQSIDDLASATAVKAIVLDYGCSYRDLLSDVLNARHIAHEVLSLASFEAIQSCVQSGVGVTLLPKEFYAKGWQHRSTRAHVLPEFAKPIETLFIRRRENQQQSTLNAFLTKSRAASNVQHVA